MEAARSLWSRYGEGYIPLQSSLATLSSNTSFASADHDTRSREPSPGAFASVFDSRAKLSWSLHAGGLRRHFVPMLMALLPSFVLPSRSKKQRKLFPTSYLDGLRGVAALFVVIFHYSTTLTRSYSTGWGLDRGGVGAQNWFLLLPVIRVVHAGRFMVVIFFVLSGYVLSHRSLKLARQGKHLELLDSLASSVFRRWLRLHLPVAASCFLGFMMGRMNWWG